LIDFSLAEESQESAANWLACFNRRQFPTSQFEDLPKVVTFLRQEGLMAPTLPCTDPLIDVTMESVSFPTTRSQRLQILTRGQTGAVTALGYAALRGWGSASLHPTVGELRVGMLPLEIQDPLGSDTDDEEENHYYIGEIRVTEVESFIPMNTQRPDGREEIDFSIGYGLCMGHNETKTIAMSILDNCLEIGDPRFPTHDEEFVLLHIDSVEATGFISHLKLPHYVTFQSKLDSLRKSRQRSA
jgi:alpha-D-ribose 1-methylphosphonate 5-triphosphate synthase subunit PhnI